MNLVNRSSALRFSCGFSKTLIFREKIFQIDLRKVPGKSLFAKHVGNGLRFALLQIPNFFFNGAGRNQAIRIHGAGLPNAMRTINRLRFHRRVPPRIVEDDVTGFGQVQPRASRAQTQ